MSARIKSPKPSKKRKPISKDCHNGKRDEEKGHCNYLAVRLFPQNKIPDKYLNVMAEDIIEWAYQPDNDAVTIHEFAYMHKMPRRTFDYCCGRHKKLGEAAEDAKAILADRNYKKSCNNKANWNAVKFMLPTMKDHYMEAAVLNTELQAKALKNNQVGDVKVVIQQAEDTGIKQMRRNIDVDRDLDQENDEHRDQDKTR